MEYENNSLADFFLSDQDDFLLPKYTMSEVKRFNSVFMNFLKIKNEYTIGTLAVQPMFCWEIK